MASADRAATGAVTATLGRLSGVALEAGAYGLSTPIRPNLGGALGRPLACRLASADELRALCGAMPARGRGVIEAAITSLPDRVTDEEYATLALLVEESRRPVTYLAVFARPGRPPGAHGGAACATRDRACRRRTPCARPRSPRRSARTPSAPPPAGR